MPLCGFNEAMIQGIVGFLEGLEKQSHKRASEESLSLQDLFEKIELPELDETIRILSETDKDNEYLGIAHLAREMYQAGLRGLKKGKNFDKICLNYRKETIKRFLANEDRFYKILRPKYGHIKATKILFS